MQEYSSIKQGDVMSTPQQPDINDRSISLRHEQFPKIVSEALDNGQSLIVTRGNTMAGILIPMTAPEALRRIFENDPELQAQISSTLENPSRSKPSSEVFGTIDNPTTPRQ